MTPHAVVYRCATPDPAQALPFGGGATGGTLHTPDDSLYLLVSRSDLWNERGRMGALAALRIRGGAGLFAAGAPLRQELDLRQARIVVTAAAGAVTVVVTCVRDRDLLVVDIEDRRPQPGAWSAALEDWHEGDGAGSPAPGTIAVWHRNRASCVEERVRRQGLDPAAIGLRDPLLDRCWGLALHAPGAAADGGRLALPPERRLRLRAATACLAPGEAGDPETALRERLATACGAPPASITAALAAHAAWWGAFWDTADIDLHSHAGDAEYETLVWRVNHYALACGLGGRHPLRFNGACYLMDGDARAWDDGYWGQNMRLVYLPLLAAGRPEWLREYIDWYLDNTPAVAAHTRARFGVEGLAWGETQPLWGVSEFRPDQGMHVHFSNNLEFCLVMEAYWRATGDDGFLRARMYPAVAGILDFYRAMARPGDDGLLHLAPASAVETWERMVDPLPDICGLRHLLPRALAWGRGFGEDPARLAGWQELLDRLPPLPVGRWTVQATYDQGVHDRRELVSCEAAADGIFLPAAGQTAPLTRRVNMENAELYVIFPWGQVGMDSPEAERRRAECTWHHRTWRLANNGWAQDAVQAARMGWREEARRALAEHASFNQRFPSGLFICTASPRFHGMLTSTPFLDSAGVHLLALQEMLVQSHDGVIRLAPALPEEWSGRCRLHTWDGLRVDLEVEGGLPRSAAIAAPRGARTLRVRNHRWEAMRATLPDGVIEVPPGGLLERSLAAGGRALLTWPDADRPHAPRLPVPEVLWPGFRARGPLAALRGGHWHDERANHGQVGLAEDGLYPAVRRPPALTGR